MVSPLTDGEAVTYRSEVTHSLKVTPPFRVELGREPGCLTSKSVLLTTKISQLVMRVRRSVFKMCSASMPKRQMTHIFHELEKNRTSTWKWFTRKIYI